MKKFFSNLLIIIYAIFAIFLTICLLSYNEFKVTEFGNYSLIIIDSNDIKGDFEKGSLVIVDTDEDPEIGEKAFFYNTSNKNEISLAEVQNKEVVSDVETTYTFAGDKLVSTAHMIGSTEHTTVIPYLGTVLAITASKWGYLFLVVLPTLLAFLYEITKVIEDIKNSKNVNEEDNEKVKEVKKTKVEGKKTLKKECVEEDDWAEENIELVAKIDELDDLELEADDSEEKKN